MKTVKLQWYFIAASIEMVDFLECPINPNKETLRTSNGDNR